MVWLVMVVVLAVLKCWCVDGGESGGLWNGGDDKGVKAIEKFLYLPDLLPLGTILVSALLCTIAGGAGGRWDGGRELNGNGKYYGSEIGTGGSAV